MFRFATCVLALVAASAAALADVTVFQQGVSPAADYAGCIDTSLRSRGWAVEKPQPAAASLTSYAGAVPVLRFDLWALGKGRVVHKAILRLYYSEVPGPPDQQVEVRTMTRDWDETATWFEHSYADGKSTDNNDWATAGGDIDGASDFGTGTPGLVAKAVAAAGAVGHYVELDVTKLVAQWVAGKRPNYGFRITAATPYSKMDVASAQWPIPAYRPQLLVEHYAAGEPPKGGVQLELQPSISPDGTLVPLGPPPGTAPAGAATVRFGRNSNCQYNTGHACGYAKQDPRYPGNWGWTPRLRAGGTGGDLNHAVLYFDLSKLPKGAKVVSARLRAFADVGNMRVPADTMGQAPEFDAKRDKRWIDAAWGEAGKLKPFRFGLFAIAGQAPAAAPGWDERQFTFAEAADGAAWTAAGGALADAAAGDPAAICDVGSQWAGLKPDARQPAMPETWLTWDVTAVVTDWAAGRRPNRGVVIDGRVNGGGLVLFSDDWVEPDRRPYLEVVFTGAGPTAADAPLAAEPLLPATEDYWVEPMRKAHARWKGTPGTFSEYGDSITVTMAFWTPLKYTVPKGITPQMQEALDTARKYIAPPCWRDWKEAKWGNTGNTTVAWGFSNIDEWQKRMNAEAAVIMWGTNDAYLGPAVPLYTEMYAAVVNRCLADGTVPIVTTLPPRGSQRDSIASFLTVWNFRQADILVARAKGCPLIDIWGEMVRRRPDDWDGKLPKFDEGGWKGYDVPTMIARDGIHPSNPKAYQNDWTEEGLNHCGFALRNYLTLKTWYEVYVKVLKK